MEVDMVLQPSGVMDVQIKVGEKSIENVLRNCLPYSRPMKVQLLFLRTTILCHLSVQRVLQKNAISLLILTDLFCSERICRLSVNNSYLKGYFRRDRFNLTTNTQRGKDYIAKLLEMYNINANNDKNEVAQRTAEFIDERISIISKELGSTERDLENFKRSAGITDLTSES